MGSGGDVHPYVGIGIELKRRGHEVVILTSEPFRETVARAGLDFVPVLSEELFEEGSSHPDLWHPQRGVVIALELGRFTFHPIWDALETRFEGRDTVVVSHALAFGARAFQVKHAPWSPTVHLAPSIFRSIERSPVLPPDFDPAVLPAPLRRLLWWVADHLVIDRHLRPWLDPALRSKGLPVASRVFRDWIHSDRLNLALFPEWFGDPRPDWPGATRLTGFPLFDGEADGRVSEGTDRFLAAGTPPVLFTAGTANRDAAGFFRTAVEAADRAGLRAILATGFPGQLPELDPDRHRSVAYEPFRALLPRCAAIVHHGGIGTTSQGLRAGIPQIVHPLGFDQGDNGDRLRRLGVGEVVVPDDWRAGPVAETLSRLVRNPGVASRARVLADRVRSEDGIARAADLLEGCLPGPGGSARETGPEPAP